MDLSLDVSQLLDSSSRADTSFYEVLLGIIIGALLGYSARKIMKFAERKKLIDRQSYVAQYVSLAILSIGMSARAIRI
jgi:NhaP-type Na+/H+ or K+/H+ antiporter